MSSIGYGAFKGLTSLESVSIADSVTAIKGEAFRGCTELTSVTIPDSVTELNFAAFADCANLESVRLGSGVTAIQNNCFMGCSQLAQITIPTSVTSIGSNAFLNALADGCDVYYGGTSAQWAAITVNANGNGRLNTAAVMHFTPEEVAVSAANFPDAAFRAYVSENIDTDHTGYLSGAEIAAVESIYTNLRLNHIQRTDKVV